MYTHRVTSSRLLAECAHPLVPHRLQCSQTAFSSSPFACACDAILCDRFIRLRCRGPPPLLLEQTWFVQHTTPKLTEFACFTLGVRVSLPTLSRGWCNFGLLSFVLLLLESLLVILINYKQRHNSIFCWDGRPTPPHSTIRDHAHFSAGPTHKVFRQVQRKEFSCKDRRKAHPLLCKLQEILAVREEFLPSQTRSHRSHEQLQYVRKNRPKDSDYLWELGIPEGEIRHTSENTRTSFPDFPLLNWRCDTNRPP